MRKVDRDTWVKKVLPQQLQQGWKQPDLLEVLIRTGLELGLTEQIEPAIARLRALEPTSERSALAAAALTLARGDADGARQQLEEVLARFPNSAMALANLSRLDEIAGQSGRALERARRAVEVAPNNEGVFRWWHALTWQRDRDQLEAQLEALAQAPGAWRPRLGWAEMLVAAADPDRALTVYRDAYLVAGDSLAALAQIVASMGERGMEREIPSVLGPDLRRVASDAPSAVWIARGLMRRGDLSEAEAILATIPATAEPDVQADVSALREEIARAGAASADPAATQVVPIPGPAWLAGLGGAGWLRARRPQDASGPVVGLLAWSVADEAFQDPGLARVAGRALPLALTESLWARTTATPQTLLPIVAGQGMISWTRPLDLEAVALCARVLPSGATVIAGHVEKGPGESLRGKAWILTPSAEQAHTVVEQADAFDDLVVVLEQKILATLSESGLVTRAEAPADLVPPAHERTASYLVALNGLALQLLAHQRLIDPAEMVNQAFAPQQYAELVRAFPGVAAPVLMAAAAAVSWSRQRPKLVPRMVELLRAAARPDWAAPLDLLLSAAAGEPEPKGRWSAEDWAWAARLRDVFGAQAQ